METKVYVWKWWKMFSCFAKQMGVIENKAEFEAVDGYHNATIDTNGIVSASNERCRYSKST